MAGSIPAGNGSSGASSCSLVVVESEGAVFDIIQPRIESSYIPAFLEHFGFSADPAMCADIWRLVAFRSRLRGTGLFRCLAASLRLANRRCPPSVRRAVVANTLEAWLSGTGDHALRSELGFRTDPVLRPAWEWYKTVESLINLLPPPAVFPAAAETIALLSRTATILAVSSESEATALSMWSSSGLLSCCARVAGRERGDMAVYLAKACAGGYGSVPVTVIGSNYTSLAAARSVEARFLPIIPGRENDSWQALEVSGFAGLRRSGQSFDAKDACIDEDSGSRNFPDFGTRERLAVHARPFCMPMAEFLASAGAFPLR